METIFSFWQFLYFQVSADIYFHIALLLKATWILGYIECWPVPGWCMCVVYSWFWQILPTFGFHFWQHPSNDRKIVLQFMNYLFFSSCHILITISIQSPVPKILLCCNCFAKQTLEKSNSMPKKSVTGAIMIMRKARII